MAKHYSSDAVRQLGVGNLSYICTYTYQLSDSSCAQSAHVPLNAERRTKTDRKRPNWSVTNACCFNVVEWKLSSAKNQHTTSVERYHHIRHINTAWNGMLTRKRCEPRNKKQLTWKDCCWRWWCVGIGAWCASRIRPKRRGYYSTWARSSASNGGSANEQMADVNTIHGLLSFVCICCRLIEWLGHYIILCSRRKRIQIQVVWSSLTVVPFHFIFVSVLFLSSFREQ